MNILRKQAGNPVIPAAADTIPLVILVCVVAAITFILYPNLVIQQHVYQPGDVVQRDIKAKKDFLIEDHAATDEKRRSAAAAVRTVYDYDDALAGAIVDRVLQSFAIPRSVYEAFSMESAAISTGSQPSTDAATGRPVSLDVLIRQQKPGFEEALGIPITQDAYGILATQRFSHDIESLTIRILTEILGNGVVANKDVLLKELDRGVTLRSISEKSETVVTALRRYYGVDQARTMVRVIGQPLLKDQNYTVRNLIVEMVQQLIQPNITLNRSETEERRKQASEAIKPVLYQIKAGEMLLREGERVSEDDLSKLEMARKSAEDKRMPASGLGAALLVACLLLAVYIPSIGPSHEVRRRLNRNLLFIGVILVAFLLMARISSMLAANLTANMDYPVTAESLAWSIPLGSGAMIVCLFLGLDVAIGFSVLLAVGTAAIYQNHFGILLFYLASTIMAAYWLQNCRERKEFFKAGLKLGVFNMVVVTAIDAYFADMAGMKLMWDWLAAFMGGFVAGIVTAGAAPLVEIAFDYTSDIKLMELANLDRPILRRLMLEAPGTYHHSVVVGSLVEAAASEIGANPLLAKVCGYYHDIGKINKPLYFIENQSGGKNKHDKLAPSMSKRILIAHVKDGVDFAREHKLGHVITDVIAQSHGTSVITYFYDKAVRQQGEDAVNIDDYRYPGPRPQTKEAGIVMLADVVEAALRTLDNPTPARLQGRVQKLINKVFSEGQLDECELTLKDLHNIAKSFIKILNGIHHHRIDYPEKQPQGNGRAANGHSDRQPAERASHRREENPEEGGSHLKRLGLS